MARAGKLTSKLLLATAAVAVLGGLGALAGCDMLRPKPHNVIIFVADGLRSQIVDDQTAPALEALRREGVDFTNSHSVFPTVTTVNGSTIATGHRTGDTGNFQNTISAGEAALPFPVSAPLAPIEDDASIGLLNARFGGDYLNEESLLAAAHAQGFVTAAVGKEGPVAVQDVTARDGKGTIVIDDAFENRFPIPKDLADAIKAAGLDKTPPDRGLNAWPGAYNMPGVQVANVEQQQWFVGLITKVLLPRFKKAGKPFVMVYWSRDPDGTQHNQGDSLNTLAPGINGKTSLAAVRNASNNLQALRDALKAQGLDKTTDIIVTADHGFSTMSKQSQTSAAAKLRFDTVVPGFLPAGFLAIDLSKALGMPAFEPIGLPMAFDQGMAPKGGSALLGPDPAHPALQVVAGGGSDLIYAYGPDRRANVARAVAVLTQQDYTGAIFVDDALGPLPGTLPMSAIGLVGSARTPRPAIVVSFRSHLAPGCVRPKPELCAVEVADSTLQQGQGIHGAFQRGDTHNFMAAVGPDFRKGFVDPTPVSNADWTPTLAKLIGVKLHPKGQLTGRVMSEALKNGKPVASTARIVRGAPAANGFVTVLNLQEADGRPYYDAAGMPGRVVGLKN
jgi:arylsulfatase A-like enzyme